MQSTPRTTGILTKVFCTSGSNLVILACTGNESSRGQTQNGVFFNLKLNFILSRSTCPNSNNRDLNQGILHLRSKFGDPGLNGNELSRGQARDYRRQMDGRIHRQTDAGNNNT